MELATVSEVETKVSEAVVNGATFQLSEPLEEFSGSFTATGYGSSSSPRQIASFAVDFDQYYAAGYKTLAIRCFGSYTASSESSYTDAGGIAIAYSGGMGTLSVGSASLTVGTYVDYDRTHYFYRTNSILYYYIPALAGTYSFNITNATYIYGTGRVYKTGTYTWQLCYAY